MSYEKQEREHHYADVSKLGGNMSAIREALEKIDRIVWDKRRHTKEEREAHRLATEALTAPPRNCDKGTAKQQIKRHKKWCDSHVCVFTYSCRVCFANWAQKPYKATKKGGAK